MAICHAAAIIVDQFADGDAGRSEDNAGVFHTAGDGPGARAGMAFFALRREPFRAFFNNVSQPPKGFDIVVQGRAAKDTHLGNIRRAVTRQPAFAFDAISIIADSSPQI